MVELKSCPFCGGSGFSFLMEDTSECQYYKIKEDVVEVVRCKDCKLSSKPKAASRYDLYCNDYDVYYCEKEQKIVRGIHYCSYGERK